MNKEWLEEVKDTYQSVESLIELGDFKQADIAMCYLVENFGKWLIEQAERAQELEEKLHFCEMTKLSMDSVEKYTEQIKSKNKRYREALVRLRNDINKQETGYEKNVFVIKTVDDALVDWEALEGKK